MSDSVYEFARLESLRDSPWVIVALVATLLAVLLYCWLVYHREARTVSLGKAMALATLRTVAVLGLVAFFLGLQKRSSSEIVEPSRVAVLVDTSLSMNLPADEAGTGEGASRAKRVRMLLAASPLVADLAEQHDVDIVAFDETARPFLYLPQVTTTGQAEREADRQEQPNADDLAEALEPAGHETRLGDAIAATLERYRGLPLAGVVLLTDGGQNRGLEWPAAAQAAADAEVPVHAVGFGPLEAPANVAVRELIAPERAFPGDKLTLQALVSAGDMAGRQIELQLLRRPAADADQAEAEWEQVASQTVTAGSAEMLETVKLETSPAEAGDYVYEVRALPGPRESRLDDNRQQAQVSVVDRQTRVLLYAGGATRDYRFLRNQLRRDESFVVDVLLGTGAAGISQDANQVLSEFPTSAEQVAEYDAIVAFDPDWSQLSADQVRWLEQWVAKQAGGLVMVPGPVNTPRWAIDSRMRTIRGLYPVRLPSQLLDLRGEDQPQEIPQPLVFTRDGNEAEFLWLADTASESSEAWEQFEGVYGPLDHQGPKAGATVYAHVAGAGEEEQGPAYLVGQYYGAGQVLMIGSGELWRLRKWDTNYVDRLWTSVLRHTSQGRLLQGSPRGKLLVSQDRYEVGATVPVRAVMYDLQMDPLVAERLQLTVEHPEGRTERIPLAADESRAGNFAGEFRVVVAGNYRLTLPVPDSTDELTRTIRVATPQLEVGQATRDADLLRSLAQETGGHYYQSPSIALSGNDDTPSIMKATPSQSRSKRVLGAIDQPFARQQSFILLVVVAGALCLEWIVRRLNYLA